MNMSNNDFKPVCMTEQYWKGTQLSVAARFGHVRIWGHEYVIVNKEGKDIFQCSFETEKAGRKHAIEPGEPADLCRRDFVKYYRKLGRDAFLQVLKDNPRATDKELAKIYKEKIKQA